MAHAPEEARSVWSLIVTFFGDCIVPRSAAVAASTLREVMDACGVEQGAVRTALSRLAADGWIERERRGRSAFYRLSNDRRSQFAQAGQLIYAASVPTRRALAIVPPPNGVALPGDRDVNGVRITLHDPPRGSVVLDEPANGWPDWLGDHWPIDPTRVGKPETEWSTDPLSALAQRILLIHDWRRLILKMHDRVLLDPAPLSRAQERVAGAYAILWPRSEAWLSSNGRSPGGPLPPARYDWRFGYTLQELLER